MDAPNLPFEGYKWRWASYAPTEGLNAPEVYLGVLRVLCKHEGAPPSDPAIAEDLGIVQEETQTSVDLVRTPDRNLIRNSGQYWKVTGLVGDSRGQIEITPFGKKVCDGEITKTEFSATVVRTFQLPNTRIMSPATVKKWEMAGLEIKPFELILSVLNILKEKYGASEAFITPSELIRITIPLSGERASMDVHAQALLHYRNGRLNISDWPNCVPSSNDSRIAREFLLFLDHYGYIESKTPGTNRYDTKYYLSDNEVANFLGIEMPPPSAEILNIVKAVRESKFPASVDRTRTLASILSRPQQTLFRRLVLSAYDTKCLISKDNVPEALEAAHIIPVNKKGDDSINNGICLRSDIHNLFDAGHLRIQPSGAIRLSDSVLASATYQHLPTAISLPPFVSVEALEWRWNYL